MIQVRRSNFCLRSEGGRKVYCMTERKRQRCHARELYVDRDGSEISIQMARLIDKQMNR